MTQSDETKRALVIGAHPDDNEFGAGGTIAKLNAQGWETTFILVTNGNKGTHDQTLSPYTLSETREHEQRAAAEALGVKRVLFLRNNDGELEPHRRCARKLRSTFGISNRTTSSPTIHGSTTCCIPIIARLASQ
jgi:LmbE family N-acetylglucosaminyl deacetylase